MTGKSSNKVSRRALAALLVTVSLAVTAADNQWTLQASDWSRPRSGAAVLDMAPVAAAVRAWNANPKARLQLVHASGEEGALWAAELRDWLIALGVAPDNIEILAGGTSTGELELHLDAQ